MRRPEEGCTVLGAPTGLGSLGTIVSSAGVHTADAAIKNAIGTFFSGPPTTGNAPQF
jgi:hypothetical protein